MWQQSFAVAFGGLLAYQVLQVIYRLTLHPLAKFPGPRIAAATKWYEFFFDVCKGEGGQYAWEIQRMHEKYGPIIRINPDEIHIKDSSYFHTIYAPSPARRDKWAPAAAMAGNSKGSFGTVDHFAHRKRRAANSALFATKTVTSAQSQVYERVRNLGHALAKHYREGSVLRVHVEVLAFTTDLMTNWILGESLGCQTDVAVAEAWYATSQCLPRITPIVKQFPWIVTMALKLPPSLVKMVIPDLASLVSLRKSMYTAYQKHAQRKVRLESETGNDKTSQSFPTVFDVLDSSDLPRHEKDIHRQTQEAFVLVAAGTETAARTITACMFQLVSHPEIYARLRQELTDVMPHPNAKPSLKTLESLPYLTAVLKENLRNMQLITSRFPLQAHTDLDYGEWTIPRMVPVSMTLSDVLLDEDIFKDPKDFKPERWLESNKHLHNSYQNYFVPFGRGTRSCQGQRQVLISSNSYYEQNLIIIPVQCGLGNDRLRSGTRLFSWDPLPAERRDPDAGDA
ncbi:hypothetical protein QQS21_012822 [Conoideocrella luteorostrata]|uniref:Cytochrome P450 n=1 Tax=Conoideocrella luteorostrata TaxID=1105319 RepID=A0AAJ0CAS7_9HYPO|nr:hypothetical protein QQS21_012822 [Conoideocrella luteorostrata]